MGKKKIKLPSEILAENLKGKGWRIVEDVKASKFEVSDLELVSFLKKGEKSVDGEEMRKRAVSLKANSGLDDAKYILDHQADIPVEFRKKYLMFPGTLFDCLHVTSLFWHEGEWKPSFVPVGFISGFLSGYEEDSAFVRSKFPSSGQA